jgi:hypothetical protein
MKTKFGEIIDLTAPRDKGWKIQICCAGTLKQINRPGRVDNLPLFQGSADQEDLRDSRADLLNIGTSSYSWLYCSFICEWKR